MKVNFLFLSSSGIGAERVRTVKTQKAVIFHKIFQAMYKSKCCLWVIMACLF